MVVGENKRSTNIMDGIENTGDVRLHDHRLRLKQRFDIVRKLGQGTYGKVQLGINKKTGQEVAIKTIKKCKIETEADLVRIRREVQIMSSVRHPNIVHIYEVFENSEKMILVMEYCSGGELYDYLSQKKVLEEEEARRLFRQIATAVYYCHIHKICHRDLKLENVLLDDTGSAKIADFGLSNVFKETSLLSTFCGSPLYASPEIVKGTPYIGPEVDCWSLGVLLYTLVYGAMPFDGSNFKRLVRQISNGDYYEPKNPSTASPLIRDMLTVDPLKRADIAYICDHPWVNGGCEASCLEVAEALAAETPVRLDLLLSLAPAAPSHSNSVLVPDQNELGPEESCTDLTSSASMPVEPSNSAEKRILELVAEGGEDAIKPSPTRTLVAAGDYKRKLDAAVSNSGLVRKKERVASSASVPPLSPALPEEDAKLDSPSADEYPPTESPLTLKSSATITIAPTPEPAPELPKEPEPKVEHKEEKPKESPKPKVVIKKKTSPSKSEEKSPEKQESPKVEESKTNSVSSTAEKLTSLSLAQPAVTTPTKPKKLSIGGHVGSFKEQFERRASLTTSPEIKRNISKPVVSKIAKPKAQSEDRELRARSPDYGATVRLQQIGIEPSPTSPEESVHNNRRMDGGVKKTESEPSNANSAVDPSVLLQDARRSLQNSMAKLVEERAGEDNRRRAARDIISSAIRTGKPPVPYGRSSSAGVATASQQSPPAPATPPAAHAPAPRVFRTEAHHKVEDHRNRGVSVERIIPIHLAGEEPTSPKGTPTSPPPKFTPPPAAAPPPAASARQSQTPIRRLASNESSAGDASPGEPIKKSAREFIIPIAVEGKGYVTPRQRSLEPEHAPHSPLATARLGRKPRRISSLVSGGESEEEEESPMHRLRSARSRPARADSVSSGEDDEEDEGFHLLTAENLFSTLLHRVRALTQRLNGEEGPGFQHPHSLFNNLQSPFFNSSHLPRRHLLREGWGSRDMGAPFDSMFKSRQQMPRGSIKRSGKHQTREPPTDEASAGLDLSDLDLNSIEFSEREMAALSGLTPALSRRLQQQLLAHLPPRAARRLRRTLSLHADPPPATSAPPTAPATGDAAPSADDHTKDRPVQERSRSEETSDVSASQFFTLPRLKRRTTPVQCVTPTPTEDVARELLPETRDRNETKVICELSSEVKDPDVRGGSVRNTPDRPLLSKYLAPERNISLDDYSSDGGSILSEPSYIMAYGSPLKNSNPSFRRHSLRLSADQPRKRISRFLRPDFFDPPSEENFVAKHKKEKELETQKILKEIREKKNRVLESNSLSPDIKDENTFRDDYPPVRKCLSPVSNILNRERSRSTTPYYPILDNIKETNLDTSYTGTKKSVSLDRNNSMIPNTVNGQNKETKLIRPKSYPIKNFETFEDTNDSCLGSGTLTEEKEADKNKVVIKESRLIRPKSYPTSDPSQDKNTLISKDEVKNDEIKHSVNNNIPKQVTSSADKKPDVEVNFSITLPKRKPKTAITELTNKVEKESNPKSSNQSEYDKDTDSSLSIKRYQVVNGTNSNTTEVKCDTPLDISNNNESQVPSADQKTGINVDGTNQVSKTNAANLETSDKKVTVKKKIIKKVTTRSKTDLDSNQSSNDSVTTDKKKLVKKIKDKAPEDSAKAACATKKKSVLQSIGHKLERFATSKSNSPDKTTQESIDTSENKKIAKLNRTQRENSVPVNIDPPTESNLIKRAVTITDVAALDSPTNNNQNKTAVSKVLGLFKKFEPKEKITKNSVEKLQNDTSEETTKISNGSDYIIEKDKVRRPTSLLLNGLGRKNRLNKNTNTDVSDSVVEKEQEHSKRDEIKNVRNSLKLDFSRLPRVKKIVPTNPVIEPLIMNVSDIDKDSSLNEYSKTKVSSLDSSTIDFPDSLSRSRSRSRSAFSANSDVKSEGNADPRDKYYLPDSSLYHLPVRNRDSLTPEKEDLAERIRRKSFYSRFNERKQRRKSNLVGPGATEYDPLARIQAAGSDHKYDISPTSPNAYDLSPGFSVASDISPSTDRYKSLFGDDTGAKGNPRYDKIDTYRSLDRNEFRKYPPGRSYYDYDQTSTYVPHRYSRTKSLFDSSESEDQGSLLREPHKYNRTNSLYTPANYATYRPMRTRNSAIILKESEKEPSPENILDKIRQRKISISVTRKSEPEKETLRRSPGPPKGEGDSSERVEKVD